LIDTWILSNLKNLLTDIEMKFDTEYNLHSILRDLRSFFLTNFCDIYIESTKIFLLQSVQEKENYNERLELTWNILRNCINISLLLYHPFIPSVTEQLWDRLKKMNRLNDDNLLIQLNYPKSSEFEVIKVSLGILNSSFIKIYYSYNRPTMKLTNRLRFFEIF
jgi:valyl-tRNA synthetase